MPHPPSHGLFVCRAPEGTGVHRLPDALPDVEDRMPPSGPFADQCTLIAFFHDREADFGEKDIILHDLIGRYRQGGQYEALAAFFLVLFTPAIASLNARGKRFYSEIGDEDLIQEICAAFLQTIRTAEIGPYKVAAQIIGRMKNNVRSVIRRRFREMRNARQGRREGVGQGIAARHRSIRMMMACLMTGAERPRRLLQTGSARRRQRIIASTAGRKITFRPFRTFPHFSMTWNGARSSSVRTERSLKPR